MIVYDGSLTNVDTYVLGPGDLLAHAYLPDSRVSLCGKTRSEDPQIGYGKQCPVCVREATRQHWTAR